MTKPTPVPEHTLAAIEHVVQAYAAGRINRDDVQLALELICDYENEAGNDVTIEQIEETFNELTNLWHNRLARIEVKASSRFTRLFDRVARKLTKLVGR